MVQLTENDMKYETLPSGNVLFNTNKIQSNGKLLALFQAFEECDMNSLKDLVPNTHLPVSKRQEEKSPQPPVEDLVDSGTRNRVTPVPFEGDEHFRGRTNS